MNSHARNYEQTPDFYPSRHIDRIDYSKYGRNLSVFSPSSEIIADLMRKATPEIQGVASLETVMRIYTRNPDTILAIGRGHWREKAGNGPLGFVCLLPLNQDGLDALFDGRRFRALTVVDNFTKESLAIEVDQQLKGEDVVAVMERLRHQRGLPQRIQTDNGSEFISIVMDRWAYDHGVVMDYSRPGKPTDNPFIESFNGSFRDECLNMHWFLSLDDARQKIESWRVDYNHFRTHSSIGDVPPVEFAAQFASHPKAEFSSPARA